MKYNSGKYKKINIKRLVVLFIIIGIKMYYNNLYNRNNFYEYNYIKSMIKNKTRIKYLELIKLRNDNYGGIVKNELSRYFMKKRKYEKCIINCNLGYNKKNTYNQILLLKTIKVKTIMKFIKKKVSFCLYQYYSNSLECYKNIISINKMIIKKKWLNYNVNIDKYMTGNTPSIMLYVYSTI